MPDAEFRRLDVVLRVAQGRDDRDLQRREEADQRLVHQRLALHAVRDHADDGCPDARILATSSRSAITLEQA